MSVCGLRRSHGVSGCEKGRETARVCKWCVKGYTGDPYAEGGRSRSSSKGVANMAGFSVGESQ